MLNILTLRLSIICISSGKSGRYLPPETKTEPAKEKKIDPESRGIRTLRIQGFKELDY